jgi:hypothetical protein
MLTRFKVAVEIAIKADASNNLLVIVNHQRDVTYFLRVSLTRRSHSSLRLLVEII